MEGQCKTLVPDKRDLTGYVCGGILEGGIRDHNGGTRKVRAFIWENYSISKSAVISLQSSNLEGEPSESTFYLGQVEGNYRMVWKNIYHPSNRRTGKPLPDQRSESIVASIKRYIPGPRMYGSGGEYVPDDKSLSSEKYLLEFVDDKGKVIGRF
jgi:hypothetical protein